jgi:hypothetical protein
MKPPSINELFNHHHKTRGNEPKEISTLTKTARKQYLNQ